MPFQAGMTFLRKVIKIFKITHYILILIKINQITFWDDHVLAKRGLAWVLPSNINLNIFG
jgi:hypothetical protein